VSILSPAPSARRTVERLERVWAEPGGLVELATTVSHKTIGKRYLVTGFAFFLAGGIQALIMRLQLAEPGNDVVGPETYDQLFSMHGITMIFLFITPVLSGGFGNYFVPLLIGARDMAFPRLNALSYWIFLLAGIFMYSSFWGLNAPNAGWFNYVPLASQEFNPGPGIDFYLLGLLFLTISTTAGAINFIVTIFKLRAPGMSVNRLPLFCWAILVVSFAIVFAFPALSAGNILLWLQRTFDWHFFDPAGGGDPLLWQHLFWIFGHPDVYIIFLPAAGIISSVIPVFSRRPIVGYTWVALSTVAIGIIGFGVWVHHMFAVGLPQISVTFFAAASLVITIPSGIQIFAWVATVLGGRPVLATPMLYALGFVVVFVVGGLTGVMFAIVPFDQQVTDSYFVVAHFHYVLFGGAVFPIFAGLYFWLPKITGRLLGEGLGKASFWTFFVGFNLAFFPMHVSGLLGMPRRVYTYPADLGWDVYNLLSTIGAFLLALGILLTLVNVVRSLRVGPPAGSDPWRGDTLEWAISSPPPEYNYPVVPRIRSAHPNWDEASLAEDRARLERGELTLADGHLTPSSTVVEGDLDEVLEMPSSSPWPLVLAVSLGVAFGGLLLEFWPMALIGGLMATAALLGWHSPGEQEKEEDAEA
jgi:cytochrome c oxidase subunit I+III